MQAPPPGGNPQAPPGNYPGYNNFNQPQPGFQPNQYNGAANVTYTHGGGLQTIKQAPPATSGTMPTQQPPPPTSSMNGYTAQPPMPGYNAQYYNPYGSGQQHGSVGQQPPPPQMNAPPPMQSAQPPMPGPPRTAVGTNGPSGDPMSTMQRPPAGLPPTQPPISQMQNMHLSGPPMPGYTQPATSSAPAPQPNYQPGMMPPPPPRPGMPPPQQVQTPARQAPPQQPGMMPPPPRPGMPPPPGPGQAPPPRPGMPPAPNAGMPPPPGQFPQQQFNQAQRPGPYPNQPAPAPTRRLDPDMMPSPIQVIQADKDVNEDKIFQTGPRGQLPPLVTTKFSVEDRGNASPRYIRCSTYNLPATSDMVKNSQIPMSVCVKPLAKLLDGEEPPYIVDPGQQGPIRCKRCKAYMCPQFKFIDGGRRFQCHMCHAITDTPHHYFDHIDHLNQRVDRDNRPELCRGSYEFIATADYCKDNKDPLTPAFIFAIDVSYNAVKSGMVELLCGQLTELIDKLPRDIGQEESKVRVGFLTYSNVIHFYNLNPSLAQPQMMVVSDVKDIFVPLQDGFLVEVDKSRNVINTLLAQIPEMFRDTRETELIFAPVIQAAVQALKSSGRAGKLFAFHSALPSGEAPGKLKARDNRELIGKDKEKVLFTPFGSAYETLAKECVAAACSVDLFLFPNQFADVATLSHVPQKTGGQVYMYSAFRREIDGQRFIADLSYVLQREVVFDCIVRVRTSTGIRATDFLGAISMSNTTDVELAALDCDKAITVELKHDDKIDENQGAHLQIAVLYTSVGGQRRLRLHNLSLSVCSKYGELYRSCETDVIINHVAKKAVRAGLQVPYSKLREDLIAQFCQVLAVYRKEVALPTSPGQLILPECMKLVPAYINSLLKFDGIASTHEISTDDRSFLRHTIMSKDVDATQGLFYPKLIPVTTGELQGDGLPVAIRCSEERLVDSHVYLLENTVKVFMWVGKNVNPEWIQNVFAVDSITKINPDIACLVSYGNEDSTHVRDLLSKLQATRSSQMKLTIVRHGDKLEPFFRRFLVEDRNSAAASYVDFLCLMHKEIRNLLS